MSDCDCGGGGGPARRELSRRSLLRGAAGLSIIGATSALLAACGGSSGGTATSSTSSGSSSGASTSQAGTSASPASGSSAQGAAKSGGTLTFGAWQDADTLDPHTTGLAATSRILIQIYDPLVWLNPKDSQYYPGLAQKWEVSSDGTQYTFHLRNDVKFHNGEAFSSASVKFSYDRIFDPATKSLALSLLGPYTRTDTPDPNTATVVFSQPYAPFLSYIGVILSMRPVSAKAYQDLGADVNVHPIGTGPFMYKEYVKADHFTMVRNPDYNWAPSFRAHKGQAYLDQVVWKIIPEPGTRVASLQSGQTNAIEVVPPQNVLQLQQQKDKYYIQNSETPGQPYMFLINTQKAPTDELAVRQACVMATDQDSIVKAVYQGVYKPSHNLMEPLTPCYAKDIEQYFQFDLKKAGQTLDSAGWTMGSDGIRTKNGQKLQIVNIVNTANDFNRISELMQATYKQIGIDMTIQNESQPSVFSTYNKGPQNFADFFFWDPSPDQLRATYGSENIATGFNWSHFNNPDFDKLVNQAATETDTTKACDLYHQAQVILGQQAAAIPIYEKDATIVVQNKIKDLAYDPNPYPYFFDTSISG
ncbi:MAG TPA: ABC transporter substrate-binding protein [Thermomicrobiaceae bacterium]|nr:ABC transporter substrate-binding protein [Thermomicrobiaceae bacterium]